MRNKLATISQSYNIAVLVALTVTYFFSFILGLFVFIVVNCIFKRITFAGYVYVALLLGVISFTNYSDWQVGDYDIVRYYNIWQQLSACDNIAQASLLIYTLRSDYLFYFITYCFTLICPEDPRWFGFCFTTLISLLIFVSLRKIAIEEKCPTILQDKWCLLLYAIGFFVVIRFFDYTNVFRQHLAFALLLVIILSSFPLYKKLILMIIPLLLHWSMFITIVPFLYVYTYKPNTARWSMLLYALLIGCACMSAIASLFGSFEDAAGYLLEERLGTDRKIMVVMFVASILKYYIILSLKCSKEIRSLSLVFALVSCFFVLRSTVMLRMSYNYTDFLVAVSPVLYGKMKNGMAHEAKIKTKKLFPYFACVWLLFGTYNLLNMNRGEFEYMLFSNYGVFSPVRDVFNTISPF